MPELQSSRFAHMFTLPPSAFDKRGREWIGEGPNVRGVLSMDANGSGRLIWAIVSSAVLHNCDCLCILQDLYSNLYRVYMAGFRLRC